MDYMMQTVRKCISRRGSSICFGDLLQLHRSGMKEWRTLRNYYKGKFFSIRMQYSKVRRCTLSYQNLPSNGHRVPLGFE
jgi:hypothetical protein